MWPRFLRKKWLLAGAGTLFTVAITSRLTRSYRDEWTVSALSFSLRQCLKTDRSTYAQSLLSWSQSRLTARSNQRRLLIDHILPLLKEHLELESGRAGDRRDVLLASTLSFLSILSTREPSRRESLATDWCQIIHRELLLNGRPCGTDDSSLTLLIAHCFRTLCLGGGSGAIAAERNGAFDILHKLAKRMRGGASDSAASLEAMAALADLLDNAHILSKLRRSSGSKIAPALLEDLRLLSQAVEEGLSGGAGLSPSSSSRTSQIATSQMLPLIASPTHTRVTEIDQFQLRALSSLSTCHSLRTSDDLYAWAIPTLIRRVTDSSTRIGNSILDDDSDARKRKRFSAAASLLAMIQLSDKRRLREAELGASAGSGESLPPIMLVVDRANEILRQQSKDEDLAYASAFSSTVLAADAGKKEEEEVDEEEGNGVNRTDHEFPQHQTKLSSNVDSESDHVFLDENFELLVDEGVKEPKQIIY